MFWQQSADNVWVVGHRGVRALYPENTLLSFEQAIALGVDGIETDVHMTTDGRLVLIHDDRLDRTTDGTGSVEACSLAELKRLDAGSRFASRFHGERIPLLEELLDLVHGTSLMLNVEIKDVRRETIDQTVSMLARFGFADRCVITCFDAEVTTYVQETHGLRTQGFPGPMVRHYTADTDRHYYSVGIEMSELSRPLCEAYRAKGIDPWCWCPDTEEDVRLMIDSGVSLATCNDPRPALRLLREQGLHR